MVRGRPGADLGSIRDRFGIDLGSLRGRCGEAICGRVGVDLGLIQGQAGVDVGSHRGRFGSDLGSKRGGIAAGPVRDHFGVDSGSMCGRRFRVTLRSICCRLAVQLGLMRGFRGVDLPGLDLRRSWAPGATPGSIAVSSAAPRHRLPRPQPCPAARRLVCAGGASGCAAGHLGRATRAPTAATRARAALRATAQRMKLGSACRPSPREVRGSEHPDFWGSVGAWPERGPSRRASPKGPTRSLLPGKETDFATSPALRVLGFGACVETGSVELFFAHARNAFPRPSTSFTFRSKQVSAHLFARRAINESRILSSRSRKFVN